MKKVLCIGFLLLSGVANAIPYTSQADHFSADFPGPVKTMTDKGLHTYGWENRDLKKICGVAVFTGKEQLGRYDTYKKIVGSDPRMRITAREIHYGQIPGLELQGIDENGVPVQGRIYAAKQATYVVIGSNFDMGASRKFVESFRILEDAPKKGAKSRKK